MTKEEHRANMEAWENEQRKKKEDVEYIKSLYETMSYRNKLLFMMVVHFLIDNPEEGEKNDNK